MANQVKPFEAPICLGYMVWCQSDDDFREPEGVVYFDSPPKIGDTAVLSGGKHDLWKVVTESNDQMEITMERV